MSARPIRVQSLVRPVFLEGSTIERRRRMSGMTGVLLVLMGAMGLASALVETLTSPEGQVVAFSYGGSGITLAGGLIMTGFWRRIPATVALLPALSSPITSSIGWAAGPSESAVVVALMSSLISLVWITTILRRRAALWVGITLLLSCALADATITAGGSAIRAVAFVGGGVAIGFLALTIVDELERRSYVDHLTGIGNRRRWADEMRCHTQSESQALGVILLDVDNFKQLNDTQGHPAGDAALVAVAALLADELGADATIVRWGGDEFIAALPADAATLTATAARLRKAADERIGLSVSVGTCVRRIGEPLETTIRRCDANLYEDKNRRRADLLVERRLNAA